jgi:CO/xanthine dehydrogenase FAD-binding subunit
VQELDGVDTRAAATTCIGGLTRVADLTDAADLAGRLPALVLGARRLGSVQIRNVATVGGNLCNASPCADLAPPLLAYDARVRIVGPEGPRELLLADFFVGPRATRLGPGEVLAAVLVDTPPEGTTSRFDKIGRVRMDIAIASLAAALRVRDGAVVHARLAMGSVAPTPLRLRAVERLLEGRTPDATLAREAAAVARDEVRPIDDVRASAAYRRHLAAVLVARAVGSLPGGAP